MLALVGLLFTVVFELARLTLQLFVLLVRATVWLFVALFVPLLRLATESLVALAATTAQWAVQHRERRR